ncbi:hypothetical protein D9758_004032 [Tetrapyrgos nigripes]|uniref:Onanonoxo-7-onima-8-eninoihtemlysoneda n=1 Tax=Tetrapyrgos nigripes TaxID=182062 RepID=A0A8H5GL94_9AGAR|nr:hypothetical protein D9758_004032 [Tetrapyrgos nigripes]
MSLLYKHLRVHQVFGANTDVGKTILTTALVRASAFTKPGAFYLKPVSTGSMDVADDEHIKRYTAPWKDRVFTECLYRYQEPVSPHLAVKLAAEQSGHSQPIIPSDETFVASIATHIRGCAAKIKQTSDMYVETAGGIHSPTLSGTTQVEAYRPLFLPTILIGDSKLGGISTTISAYESLVLRGFIVDSVLLFRDKYYRNWEYLQEYFADRGIQVTSLDPPPELLANPSENFVSTQQYYDSLMTPTAENGILTALKHLDSCHVKRLQELDSMPRRTLDSIWWPFVQHGLFKEEKDVNVIDSAYSDFFSIRTPPTDASSPPTSLLQPQFDGSASWWTQTFGHAHSSLTLAAARAAGRYGHVMFPRATNLPALKLAETLIHEGPGKGWASRAFFSDDGSTGMEVALKMALRAYSKRHNLDRASQKTLGILGLKGSYHGDTIGAMDACEEVGVYTCEWHNAKGFWLEPPSVSIQKGKVVVTVPPSIAGDTATRHEMESLSWTYDVQKRLSSELATVYKDYLRRTLSSLQARGSPRLGALVLEPLVMGAGGMIFVDPLFQRVLIDVVRNAEATPPSSTWSGLPVIFDEVFVGLHRIGMESTPPLLGVNPDISVNAKILTGGLVPLAVTLASNSIFEVFLSENKADALLHGHSYTAHAVGCEVANETLSLIKKVIASPEYTQAQQRWETSPGEASTVWSLWDPSFIDAVSRMERVSDVMALGTVLAIKLVDDNAGYTSHSAEEVFKPLLAPEDDRILFSSPGGAPFGVHYRTLGNIAYFMCSLTTTRGNLQTLEDKLWQILIPK